MQTIMKLFTTLCLTVFSIVAFAQDNRSEFSHLLSSEGYFKFMIPLGNSQGSCTSNEGSFILTDEHSPDGFNFNYIAMEIGGKWGFVNLQGEIAIPAQYDDVRNFSCDLAAVKINGKWGFINDKNEIVIPCIYYGVSSFSYCFNYSKEYAMVTTNRTDYYLIDKNGNRISDKTYSSWSSFSNPNILECLIAVKSQNGKWGFIDFKEKYVVEPRFDYVYGFSSGLAAVEVNGKWGYINTSGEFVIEPHLKEGGYFRNGMLSINMGDNKYGFRDVSGNIIGPNDDQYSFYKGDSWEEARAWVKRNGKWGQIDIHGNVKIPFIYDMISSPGSNIAIIPVKKDGKWGYINLSGKTVIPFIFDHASEFCKSTGIASVGHEGKFMYIHKSDTSTMFYTYKDAYEKFVEEKVREEEDELLEYLLFHDLF